MLQPLDVSVFSPLKRALAAETDAASRLDTSRVSRIDWTSMYIRVREQAFRSPNILSSFKATGLWPLSPITLLKKLSTQLPTQALEPQNSTTSTGLNLSLLLSDPLDGTELREANALYAAEVQAAAGLTSPVKRYIS